MACGQRLTLNLFPGSLAITKPNRKSLGVRNRLLWIVNKKIPFTTFFTNRKWIAPTLFVRLKGVRFLPPAW